jgi:hypothetical protein
MRWCGALALDAEVPGAGFLQDPIFQCGGASSHRELVQSPTVSSQFETHQVLLWNSTCIQVHLQPFLH